MDSDDCVETPPKSANLKSNSKVKGLYGGEISSDNMSSGSDSES